MRYPGRLHCEIGCLPLNSSNRWLRRVLEAVVHLMILHYESYFWTYRHTSYFVYFLFSLAFIHNEIMITLWLHRGHTLPKTIGNQSAFLL